MPGWLKWGLLALWALSLLAGMLLYSQRQLSEFDPGMTLSQAAASPDFDARFVTLLETQGVQPGSIVHLQKDTGCYCNQLTDPHTRQLAASLEKDQFRFRRLSLDTVPELKALIPTFPAVAVVDKQRKLRYLGPYATGYGCFTGATLVESIAHIATSEKSLGAVINTSAEGCFCAV